MSLKNLNSIDHIFLEQQVLRQVNKPARYLGIEYGAFRKDPELSKVHMASVFPDLYEIGVSNYGHKLLYSLVNQQADYLCDRAYAPAMDMAELLKKHEIPLYGLETLQPLKNFDLLAFTLQYELNYTTILGILELAEIPLRTAERNDWTTPLIIAGGPGSGNPMPLSPFFDAFIIGDGEEVLLEILDMLQKLKIDQACKDEARNRLSTIEGVFVPGVSKNAKKRIVDISRQDIELAPLVPFIQTVHDRVTVEARRGCERMCRFCQPCFVNLPVREQKIEHIKEQALKDTAKTGYKECSLLSLSIADYSFLKPLIKEVSEVLQEEDISLSLPSQRADRFDTEIAEAVCKVRKSTLTFAPEAGTERLRSVLNKNLTEEEILNAVTSAYKAGWNKVKLYFMIGLPTETDEDLRGIAELVDRLQSTCKIISREEHLSLKKRLEINVTFSNFVPKPHTPFQWVKQDSMEELYRKQKFLKQLFASFKGVKLSFTNPEISHLEAIISRGDESMANIIEKAYKKGSYLEAWGENLNFSHWFESLKEMNFEYNEYSCNLEAPLPWDNIDMGVDKSWLINEYNNALKEVSSKPCFVGCSTCGVCSHFKTHPVFMKLSDIKESASSIITTDTKVKRFPLPSFKVRLGIQKKGHLRFISHLDWLRMLQRAISRAKIPIAYSQGFNPIPKISFGPALPLFIEGIEEYIDLEMVEKTDDLVEKLNNHLPEEGKILHCEWLPLHASSLDKILRYLVYSAQWTCSFSQTRYTLSERVDALIDQSDWIVDTEKKTIRKKLDIKPYIKDISLSSSEELVFTIKIDRQTQQVKPVWFLNLIDSKVVWDIKRLKVGLFDDSKIFVKV